MALADLMKKGFLTSVTATPATLATHQGKNRLTVATVAGVAVTNPSKLEAVFDAGLLYQFRFDLVQSDIDAGYPADDLHRVNNMAWSFMQTDGMGFEEAITRAAVIVAASQITASEAAYIDVLALFLRLQTKGGI
jgi:hypothetical protein